MATLCVNCSNINFLASPIQSEPQPDFYERCNFSAEEQPSDATGRFYAYQHSTSAKVLEASAASGCHLCLQFLRALERTGLQVGSPHDYHDGPVEARWYPHQEKVLRQSGTVKRELYVVARTGLRDIKAVLAFVRYGCEEDRESSWLEGGPSLSDVFHVKTAASRQPWNTGCDENFLLASMWLRKCLESHSLCAISTQPNPPLPARVLDVGSRSGTEQGIRLVNGLNRHGPYVTLSHAWGRSRVITTTASTIQQRRDGISLSELSQTFRDAVTVARKLLVRYLWIDSLCIIQDSAEDWPIEAAKMGQYYSNSLLTISAVSAPGGDHGIFCSRNPHVLTPCPTSVSFPKSEDFYADSEAEREADSAATPDVLTGFIHPVFAWDPSEETHGYLRHRPPLWQRAWVMQERVLPPRLLMFSDAQMSWLCRSDHASECVPEGGARGQHLSPEEKELQNALLALKKYYCDPLPDNLDGNSNPEALLSSATGDRISLISLDIGTGSELEKLHNAWYDLVTDYTKCGLTVKSDIFPAISGIASTLQRAIAGEQFVAGLWRSDLARGLLWSAVDSTKSMPDLREYRAPSWSWASLPGPCVFTVRQMLLQHVVVHLQVVNVALKTDPRNRFGQVDIGSTLTAVGPLKKAYPARSEDLADCVKALSPEFRGSENLFDLEVGVPIGWYIADNQDRVNLTQTWCVPILSCGSSEDDLHWYCLAMVEISRGLEHPLFMRVGMAWITKPQWFEKTPEKSFSVL